MTDCIFCKITSGDLGTEFLHESDGIVVFRDINPQAKTHLLIVPKMHIETIAEVLPEEEFLVGRMVGTARDVAEELGLSGYKLQFNVGKSGGQEVFHIHLHLKSSE